MKRAFILFLVVTVISCSPGKVADIKDYPIITTIKELAEYYGVKIDSTGNYENTRITRYPDGSSELEYEYDLIETDEYDPIYYSITIEKERTIKDAKDMYTLGKGTLNFVGNSFHQGIIEIDSIQLPGDDSYYALRTYDGEPNGMLLKVRKGTRIYTMIISGLYTLDHSLINDLLIPKIAHLEDFEIMENKNGLGN